jgi:D-beta-D-heptose 7-phosphate kinase/D-beta-D-heptose 1-phosphate adenosyltransferase
MKKKMRTVKTEPQEPKLVVVSGGFDPIHIGHIRMITEAKKFGDKLIVIMNNDNWLIKKKGYFFMPEKERKEIIEAISGVDKVVLTKHNKNPKDMSVTHMLKLLKPNVFVQGGDRKPNNLPSSEMIYCEKNNCKMVYGVGKGGKVQSSSWLSTNFINEIINKSCPCKSGKEFKVCGLKNTSEHKKYLKKLLNS